jgi:uncharacterized membrane protein
MFRVRALQVSRFDVGQKPSQRPRQGIHNAEKIALSPSAGIDTRRVLAVWEAEFAIFGRDKRPSDGRAEAAPPLLCSAPAMNQMVRYFVRGCLATVPIALTLYILYALVTGMDALLGVGVPGLGLLLAVILVTLIGFGLSNVVGRRIFQMMDKQLARVPLVKLLYTSLRDLVGAFMGERKKFGRPVAVRPNPASDIKWLGFLTREDLSPLGYPHHVAVYFPQAYNVAGQLMIVSREQIEPLAVPSSELITFLVSGGASGFGMGTPSIPPPPPDTAIPPRVVSLPPDAPPPPGIYPPASGPDEH